MSIRCMQTYLSAALACSLACGGDGGSGFVDAGMSDATSDAALDAGPTFSPSEPTLLALGNPLGSDDDPFLLRAADDTFYLVYLSVRADNNTDLWITRSLDGLSWSAPVRITEHADANLYPSMVQTGDGVFHLAFTRFMQQDPFTTHVYYTSSTDGMTWDPDDELAVTTGLVDDAAAHMVLGDDDELWIYFSNKTESPNDSRDLYRVVSADGGGTWSARQRLDALSTTNHEVFPWVAERGAGDYTMVFERYDEVGGTDYFHSSADIFSSTSTDGLAWTAPAPVTSDASDDKVDTLPSLFWAQQAQEWTISWTSTAHSDPPRGDLIDMALDDAPSYPTDIVNRSALNAVPGWSARTVATPTDGVALTVWVTKFENSKPQLWSQLIER